MSTEENKAIVRRFFQVWGKGDLGVIDELASPELSVYYPTFPQTIKGGEAFKTFLKEFRSAITDPNLDEEEEIAEGDKVVISWSFSGTHQGTLGGIPPTGKKVNWTGITIYRIADGKVIEEKGEEDSLALMRHGLIPPVEQSK